MLAMQNSPIHIVTQLTAIGRGTRLIIVSLLLHACASNPFESYPQQAESYREQIRQQGFKPVEIPDNRNALLAHMEQGRVAHATGAYAQSVQHFNAAIARFEEQDLQAKVRLSEGLYQGAALLSNDKALPYAPAGFERILVHHWQALNYLALGLPESAQVELRRARLEQEVLSAQYEAEIAQAQQKAASKGWQIPDSLQDVSGLEIYASELKSRIQNAYTYAFASAVWHAFGEKNSALVDAKLALELNPENATLLQHVKALESKPSSKTASVWVFVEQGFVAEKIEKKFSFPNFGGEILSLALPGYAPQRLRQPLAMPQLSVKDSEGNTHTPHLQPITDLNHLAAAYLEAELPTIIVRQALRMLSKQQMQQQVGRQLGDAAKLLAAIYTVVSESADLRSWLTLPQRVLVSKAELAPGQHQLILRSFAGEQSINIDVPAGGILIVRCLDVDGPPQCLPVPFV